MNSTHTAGTRRGAGRAARWRYLATLAGVGLLALGAAACGSSSPSGGSSESPWVIGAVADLSGPDAQTGEASKKAVDYWVKTFNDDGGISGRHVEVKYCDTKSVPAGGATCGGQLDSVNSHVVLFMAGLPTSQTAATRMRNSIGLAIAPVVLPKAGTNIFQAAPVISQVVKPLVDGAKAQKITSLGVLYTSDAPGQAQLGAVTAAAKAAGIAVDSKPIEPTATDVSPQLLQLKSDGAQVIFSATLGAPTTTVLSSYHSLGMTIPLVVGAANVTNDFLNSISYGIPSTLYGISTMAKGDGFDAATAKAWSDYQRNYRKYAGEPVDSEGATGAYIACIAKEVIANTKGASGAAAQKYLEENTLTCLGSPIQFGVNGLNVANGVPNELLQAGRTADDGWVPVTTPL